ncbi:MAG: thiamine pyrophosphokinase [Pseudomonadota bacterium]
MKAFEDIVADATIVTLLGAGDVQLADLQDALALAPTLVCADAGVDRALDFGHMPLAGLGDLDSLDRARADAAGVPLFELADQDFGDFDKALAKLGGHLVLAVGFLGARFDHQLAALTALVRAPGPVVLIGSHDVACIIPRHIKLDLLAGTRVSLWPLAPSKGRSSGLRWPIDGLSLDPQGRIGTSNMAEGAIEIAVQEGALILVLPRSYLDVMAAALS